jgi:hypothetical protein
MGNGPTGPNHELLMTLVDAKVSEAHELAKWESQILFAGNAGGLALVATLALELRADDQLPSLAFLWPTLAFCIGVCGIAWHLGIASMCAKSAVAHTFDEAVRVLESGESIAKFRAWTAYDRTKRYLNLSGVVSIVGFIAGAFLTAGAMFFWGGTTPWTPPASFESLFDFAAGGLGATIGAALAYMWRRQARIVNGPQVKFSVVEGTNTRDRHFVQVRVANTTAYPVTLMGLRVQTGRPRRPWTRRGGSLMHDPVPEIGDQLPKTVAPSAVAEFYLSLSQAQPLIARSDLLRVGVRDSTDADYYCSHRDVLEVKRIEAALR